MSPSCLEDQNAPIDEVTENTLVVTVLVGGVKNPEDCGFKVEDNQLSRPVEPLEESCKMCKWNGATLTEVSKLRELRAACSVLGVGQSGSRKQSFQRIASKLKENGVKAAAEVVANAQREVAREPRVQPVIPVPNEDEQNRHRLLHRAHRAKQDRRLRTGNSKASSTPIISLDFCYTKAGVVEKADGGGIRVEGAQIVPADESSIPRTDAARPALWMVMVCNRTVQFH